jgi:hypothetical protein
MINCCDREFSFMNFRSLYTIARPTDRASIRSVGLAIAFVAQPN